MIKLGINGKNIIWDRVFGDTSSVKAYIVGSIPAYPTNIWAQRLMSAN